MRKKEKRITRVKPPKEDFKKGIHIYVDKRFSRSFLIEGLRCKARLTEDKQGIVFNLENLNKYIVKPVSKLKNLLKGRVQTTTLTWFEPPELPSLALPSENPFKPIRPTIRPRRLVKTDFPLTREEKYKMRDKGIFPIEEAKGETTRLEGVRLDTETEKQLKLMMFWHKQKTGKEPTLSDIIRLCIHREFVRQEQRRKANHSP